MSFSQGQPNGYGTVQRPRKIGLWGATSSGKTAFLAALFVAVNQNRDRWKIVGADRTSVNFLANQTDTLTRLRRFPDKTEGIQQLSWTLIGTTEQEAGGRLRRRTVEVPLYIQLDLIDSAGSLFKGEDRDATSAEQNIELGFDDDPAEEEFGVGVGFDQLVDKLVDCDGIVYLFDPLREHTHGDEYQYFQRTLQEIAFRSMQNGTFNGTYLPHHLAVCVTKLDEPKVYKTARERRYLTVDPNDPHLFPRVRDDRAESLFKDLGNVSPTRSALMVHDAIGNYFRPDSVRYFASSSVGFFLGRNSTRFQDSDFQNVVPDDQNGYRIRGDIHPINVLEPLLWLGQQVDSATR